MMNCSKQNPGKFQSHKRVMKVYEFWRFKMKKDFEFKIIARKFFYLF